MKRKLTPQEKKAHRYDRDHVTRGWHSAAAFRKRWRKKETAAEQAYRRKWHALEARLVHSVDPEAEYPEGEARRRQVRKSRPPSVRELLDANVASRRDRHSLKARGAAARAAAHERDMVSVLTERVRKKFIGSPSRLRDLPSVVAAVRGLDRSVVSDFLAAHPDWLVKLRQWRRANLVRLGVVPKTKSRSKTA
jgi:hypothetical protein